MDTEKFTVSRVRFLAFTTAARSLCTSAALAQGDDTLVVDYGKAKHAIALGLALIDPKQPFGTELFDALCGVTISTSKEAVCVRRIQGKLNVLLTQRSKEETAGPGEWHCPGSAQRPGESDDDVFSRLETGEFKAPVTRVFIETWNNPREYRGHFRHDVFLCQVGEGAQGTWFPVDQLPEKTSPHHRDTIIPMAIAAFIKREREGLIRDTVGGLFRTLIESDRGGHFFTRQELWQIAEQLVARLR